MHTELVWDGKYEDEERRIKKEPFSLPLPFQDIETINETAQDRQRTLEELYNPKSNGNWRNKLIWGDKKYVLPSLLDKYPEQINLIYIDPPFDTGANFSFQVTIEDESFVKEPSMLEIMAYRDTWGGKTNWEEGLPYYLQWFYETVTMLYKLLAPDGSMYVHLDWHVGHYAKTILDEIFGRDHFQNEICWKRATSGSAKARAKKFGADHDVIYFYSKGSVPNFNQIYAEYPEEEIQKRFRSKDEKGHYKDAELATYSEETLQRLRKENRLIVTSGGKYRYKIYLEEVKGVLVDSVWADIPIVNSQAEERLTYATQKPEPLLERIINASSKEGDLVLDCFCGSGTTPAVAGKLGRRWIACDLGRFAIHTTRKRLLSIPDVQPFVVQNLGRYERQFWQEAEFGDNASERIAQYLQFILDLYHAQPLTGYTWLHGVKAGTVIHVGPVDAPVTMDDVRSVIIEWRKSLGKTGARSNRIDILGWEFSFEVNQTAQQQAAEAGVDLKFRYIPREVLEKKAGEQGDIMFFELAALFVNHTIEKRELCIELTNFITSLEYIPQEVRERIKNWESWIDYWAVDFDFRNDTFHNQWQTYRTRKGKSILKKASHIYEEPGTYLVQVKVIDILGSDTTKTMQVQIL